MGDVISDTDPCIKLMRCGTNLVTVGKRKPASDSTPYYVIVLSLSFQITAPNLMKIVRNIKYSILNFGL